MFACPNCAGTVALRAIGPGRTRRLFGITFDLPPEHECMVCDSCGEMYTSPECESALDAMCRSILENDIAASATEAKEEAALWNCTAGDGIGPDGEWLE